MLKKLLSLGRNKKSKVYVYELGIRNVPNDRQHQLAKKTLLQTDRRLNKLGIR
jgi:hypothetical protein